MFSTDDTIAAIATPPGRGGLGIVRLSGPAAPEIAGRVLTRRDPLAARFATSTRFRSGGRSRDSVVATWFPAPASFTGEHVVEIGAHGSAVVLQEMLQALVAAGARLARPGEFTLRAFLNGRLDLVQAEAVADLIDAATPLQAERAFEQLDGGLSRCIAGLDADLLDLVARLEASLDFPDEGYHFIGEGELLVRTSEIRDRVRTLLAGARHGRLIRDGATVAIVGRPNVGKSSLFNALLRQASAIVTDVPGTTRDLLKEHVEIEGIPVTLIDTAGIRPSADHVEQEGIARAIGARQAADLVLLLLDLGDAPTEADRALQSEVAMRPHLIVGSKADRAPAWSRDDALPVSVIDGRGIDDLRAAIGRALTGGEAFHDGPLLSNLRHIALLHDVERALTRAIESVSTGGAPEEFVLVDLHQARAALAEVVGASTHEDVLAHIFDRFCIGK